MRRALALLAVAAALIAPPAPAQAQGQTQAQGPCRLALALGLDVSGSVDDREYAVQMRGLAAALLRPAVQEALFAFPDAPVQLYVYTWAGQADQAVVLPWTRIDGPERLAEVAGTLRRAARTPMAPATGIGRAMLHGAAALAERPGCWRRTLDLSGDGENNSGPRPRDVAADPRLAGITVNGLAIGAAAGTGGAAATARLLSYYRAEVIRGPDAFVELAQGHADFEAAMARKLLKELLHLVLTRDDRR